MDLGAKKTLANARPAGDRFCGHPDVDAESRDVRFPHVLVQIMCGERSGKAEIPTDRLANPLTIEATR